MQPAPQDIQLMSKHRVLSFKPQLRLQWQGQDGQNETEQPDHSASLGDSITSSTRIRFSVHTGDRRATGRRFEGILAETMTEIVDLMGVPPRDLAARNEIEFLHDIQALRAKLNAAKPFYVYVL